MSAQLEVPDTPDRRLWIWALSVALAERARARKRCTVHVFNILIQDYRDWDPYGFGDITEDGLREAMHVLSL